MRALALALVLATGCVEADLFEPAPEPAGPEPTAGSLSLVASRCSYSSEAPFALQVETKFDVTLQAFNSYAVAYMLPDNPADDGAYTLVATPGCGDWQALAADQGTVGCYRDDGGAAEQIVTTRATSTNAPVTSDMQITVIARISDDQDSVVVTDRRTIDCAPN